MASVMLVTWRAKLPSQWWFLPWMSDAIAPPTVTWRVPGETATNQPRGMIACMRWCRLTPPPTSMLPDASSSSPIHARCDVSTTSPPLLCAASP